jgi:predicted TIM-barrel fold metal-dependent hydrolase
VQVVRSGEGTALAREANDIAAEACRRHPARFSACAAFDPRDVTGSVREIERAMTQLKLSGAVLNSHFQGHYLDEPEFEPIVEALAANDAALYIHPTMPWYASPIASGFFGALGGFRTMCGCTRWYHLFGPVRPYHGLRLVSRSAWRVDAAAAVPVRLDAGQISTACRGSAVGGPR